MKRKTIKLKTIYNIIIAIFIAMLCTVLIKNSSFAVLIASFFIILLFALSDIKNNILLISFMVCFFVFLVGRPICYELLNYSKIYTIPLSQITKNNIYIYLAMSLIFVAIGYLIISKVRIKKKISKDENQKNNNESYFNSLQKISKIFAIILYLIVILENILKYFKIKSIGYTESFSFNYNFNLPYGLHNLVEVAPVPFCLFLATLPKKKDSLLPISLFFFSNLITALYGNRFEIISCILFILIYSMLRNNFNEEIWIRKKQIFLLVILTPFIIILMQYMTYWRDGNNINSSDNPTINFLYGVGGSSDLIGITYEYGDRALSRDTIYSFGYVWRNINGNILAKIFKKNSDLISQTADYALNGHSLSSALTYYFYPSKYLKGYGLGGCYIAELYHDFGIFGIIIGNMILGIILGLIRKLKKYKIIHNFLCIYMIILLLRIPRDSFDSFIGELIGIKNIMTFLFIILIPKIKKNNRRN